MSPDAIWEFISTKLYPAFLVAFFFGLTIFIHELGHFWMARRKGMKIERFSIGFGPKIVSWQKDGIDYRISWIPFGGYVALPQMSPMETIEGKTESSAADLPPASPRAKIAVAIAGPVMNILLALFLACLVWWIGLPTPVNPSVVGYVEPGSLEELRGIQVGDKVVMLNGESVKTWTEVQTLVALSREPTIKLTIQRNEVQQDVFVEREFDKVLGVNVINLGPEGRPVANEIEPGMPAAVAGVKPDDEFLAVDDVPVGTRQELIDRIKVKAGQVVRLKILRDGQTIELTATPVMKAGEEVARIGVSLNEKLVYEMVRPGPTPIQQFRDIFRLMGRTFYALFHSKQTGVGAHSLSGPVGIMGGWWYEIMQGGVMRGVWFAVLLNINLAIINMLPLPVLDGGHIVFSLLELVRRKPLNSRLVQNLSVAFAVLLIGFMLYITFFDVQRFFGRRGGNSAATNGVSPVIKSPTAPTAPAPQPTP